MALWPFCPRADFTEALAWYTDVLPSYSAEQRIRLTNAPRQSFAYSHAFTPRQYERAKLMMQNSGAAIWYLPVWAERQRVSVGSGAGSITVDTTASDYRAGSVAMLWASDEEYELVITDAVASGSLTLAGEIDREGHLRLMHAGTDALVEGAEAAAQAARGMHAGDGQGLALLVSCVGRKLVMGGRVDEEIEAVAEVFGQGACIAGFYSNGEISPFTGNRECRLHNQTMTITHIAEA